jgi:SAM-dependent methyltransferase
MERDFRNVYDDAERANAYAKLDFPGTYHLAFRDLPALFERHVRGTRALDFGCGAGRSTRLLKRLGYQAVGVDISQAMLNQARDRDSRGDYRLVTGDGLAKLGSFFDLILAAFTFDNVPTDAEKIEALVSLRQLLASGGRFVAVVSSPQIYTHEWASFSTRDFPENRDALDGDRVRIVMLDVPDPRPVEDVVCGDAHYRQLFAQTGWEVLELVSPRGTVDDGIAWVTEREIAPWSVYVLGAA